MTERRNGTRRLYRARPEGLAELKTFLEEFWDARLETLKVPNDVVVEGEGLNSLFRRYALAA